MMMWTVTGHHLISNTTLSEILTLKNSGLYVIKKLSNVLVWFSFTLDILYT